MDAIGKQLRQTIILFNVIICMYACKYTATLVCTYDVALYMNVCAYTNTADYVSVCRSICRYIHVCMYRLMRKPVASASVPDIAIVAMSGMESNMLCKWSSPWTPAALVGDAPPTPAPDWSEHYSWL